MLFYLKYLIKIYLSVFSLFGGIGAIGISFTMISHDVPGIIVFAVALLGVGLTVGGALGFFTVRKKYKHEADFMEALLLRRTREYEEKTKGGRKDESGAHFVYWNLFEKGRHR